MKLRPFELFLLATFLILGLLAVLLLGTYNPDPPVGEVMGPVVIWGTLPQAPIKELLDQWGQTNPSFRNVQYVAIDPRQLNERFVTALADRTNPDLLLLSQEELVTQRNRLRPVSDESLPLRDFKNQYVDGAEIFFLREGAYARPLAVDPLVLFWNRSLHANAGLVSAPASWEALVNQYVPALTKRDFDRTVSRSAIALGESTNIEHLTPVLSLLFMQAGSQLVVDTDQAYEVRINMGVTASSVRPFTQALDFFMRFSNPEAAEYSWNRSLSLDRDAFVREELALYFGFASEGRSLGERNPNLDYDVAEVPKSAAVETRRTYGRFYGLAQVFNAGNPNGAAVVQSLLSEPAHARALADAWGMASALRSEQLAGSNDLFGRVAYQAAPVARGWLMPDAARTRQVFAESIAQAAADRYNIGAASATAIERLELAY